MFFYSVQVPRYGTLPHVQKSSFVRFFQHAFFSGQGPMLSN